MKVATLFLICGVAFAAAAKSVEIYENGCPVNQDIHQLLPHENCNQFYQCVHGDLVALTCEDILLYNTEWQVCDWPQNVDCGERVLPGPQEDEAEVEVIEPESRFIISPDYTLEDAQIACAKENSEGLFIEHQLCNRYYVCTGGVPVEQSCPGTLFFNQILQTCDFRLSVDCGSRT